MKGMTLSSQFVKNLFIISILFVTCSAAVNELQFDGGNYNVTWNYLSASQEIEFEVRAKATGYVALGLTKTNSAMQNLDLFAGGVNSGVNYLKDYYATGQSSQQEDPQQNYTLLSASESNGETTVRCKRKLNTGDAEDLQIQPGDSVYIAWAYHSTSDTLEYHTERGYSSQMHVLVPVMTTSSPSPTTVGPTSEIQDLRSETPTTNVLTTSTITPSSTSLSTPSSSSSISSLSSSSPPPPPTSSSTSSSLSSSPPTTTTPSSTSSSLSSSPPPPPTPTSSSTSSTLSSSPPPPTTTTSSSTSSTLSSSPPPPPPTPTPSSTSSSTPSSSSSSSSPPPTSLSTSSSSSSLPNTNTQGVVQNTRTTATYTVAPTTSEGPTSTATVSPTSNPVGIAYNRDKSFNNGDYHVFWKFDSSTNELFFKLVVKAGGWVGLGISNTNTDMKNMDVVVAGVSGGQNYIGDYYSTAKESPPRDTTQDYTLRSATESGGTTTVEFKRKINTGDDKDLQIVVGESYYLAWAYHSSSDSLSYHSQRGYSGQKVVLAAVDPTTSSTTEKPTTEGSAVTEKYSLVMIILSLVNTLIVH